MWSLHSIAIRSLFDGRGCEPITNRILIVKLQLVYSYSSARTEALLKSSSEIILWHLDVLLKESVIWKINASIWFRWMKKKTSSLIEDNDKMQRAYTRRNPKRHISLVSLLLWCKVVAMCYFVRPLGL